MHHVLSTNVRESNKLFQSDFCCNLLWIFTANQRTRFINSYQQLLQVPLLHYSFITCLTQNQHTAHSNTQCQTISPVGNNSERRTLFWRIQEQEVDALYCLPCYFRNLCASNLKIITMSWKYNWLHSYMILNIYNQLDSSLLQMYPKMWTETLIRECCVCCTVWFVRLHLLCPWPLCWSTALNSPDVICISLYHLNNTEPHALCRWHLYRICTLK